MLKLRKKKQLCAGTVLFRGSPAPRPEHMSYLERAGISLAPAQPESGGWRLRLSHPKWGPAEVLALPDIPLPPRTVALFQAGLSEADLSAFDAAGHSLQVSVPPEGAGALRDRKRLLWYLRQVMADDGLIALDHLSQLVWPRAALDDEVAHEADVDVEALYSIHAVCAEGPAEASEESHQPDLYWVHTHGLGELGALDLDILRPSRSAAESLPEALRCLAFGVLEGSISAGEVHQFADPGGFAHFVDAATFDRSAASHCRDIRDADDHTERRVVLCEPRGGGLSRLLRPLTGSGYRPCRFFTRAVDDNCVFGFSTAATELMTQRARATIGVFRDLVAEFADMPATPLVKLGYTTSEGAEHLWFEVHEIRGDQVDATLINQPFADVGMSQGDRGERPLELLSDWSISTPAGSITPRTLAPARAMREHRSEIMEMMAAEG